LQIKPDDPATVMNCTRVLLSRWGPGEALRVLSGVIGEGAAAATAWVAAGDVLLEAELYEAGIQAYQRALDLAPGDQPLQYKVLSAITREGPPERAEPLILQRLAAEGRLPKWLALLAQLRLRQARVAEGAEALRTALLSEPNPVQHSTLLTLLQYGDGVRPERLLADHRSWDRLYAAPLFPNPPPAVERARGDRRLRLGFVSFDFARHPVGYMVLPMIEHLDKSQCQVFCYLVDRTRRLGHYTSRFRAAADRWSHVVDAADDALAQEIREDQIDILFDLSGHHGKRLLVFARKPAPLQVTWFGYVGTTGMRAMDYLLADRFHVAPGEERFYCERVLRMPHGYASYEPPPDSPDVGPLPAQRVGRVTFGCFNNPFKINPTMIDAWARILHAVPDSQLLLKFRGYEQEEMRDRIRVEFAQRKIEVRRIVFEGWSEASQELLSTYNRVDLALDTLPYSGGLTTCEALWMGVPVITHPGRTFAGRHAVSHLTNAGFPQFVARDRSGYVELAIQWANRLDELAAIRGQMREQMRRSPLCDAPQFARDFLSLMNQTVEAHQS
jgi:predicted O-linked N-acetylglucosamine transferase (SPINDLY family)